MIKRASIKTVSLLLILTHTLWAEPIPSLEVRLSRETPSFLQIDIPNDLASVEEVYEAPAKLDPKLVLHIQNIHGNYNAQVQVKKMLDYFYKNYAFKVIFVEGASEKLNPEYLELFPEKENNLKLADALARKGQLTGPELYMMDAPKDVQAIGIEQADLYRGNYEAFKTVYGAKEMTDVFLKKMDARLELLSSRFLTRDMRRILSEWQKFHEGRREFLPFVKQLAGEAQKFVNVDLQSLFAQVEWPQLARMMVLQSMEPDLKREEALAQRDHLLAFLREKKASAALIEGIERLEEKKISLQRMAGADGGRFEPRRLLERLVEEEAKNGFRFHQYPDFSLYAGYLILQSELDTKVLFEEMEKLFEKILETLSSSEKEKNLLEVYKDMELLKKLVTLELSRKEWERANYRRDWMRPEALCERLQKLSRDGFVTEDLTLPPSIPSIFAAAFNFYDFARKRETVFYQTIRREMDAQHADRAILVTGGFHTDGLAETFRQEDISYGILTPRLGGDFDKTNYVNTLMERHPTRFDLAHMELINQMLPFLEQMRLGKNPESLKGLLEEYFKIFEEAYGNAAQPQDFVGQAIRFFNAHFEKTVSGSDALKGKVGFQLVRHPENQWIYHFNTIQKASDDQVELGEMKNAKGPYFITIVKNRNDGKFHVMVSTGEPDAQSQAVTVVPLPQSSDAGDFNVAGVVGEVKVTGGRISATHDSIQTFQPDDIPNLNAARPVADLNQFTEAEQTRVLGPGERSSFADLLIGANNPAEAVMLLTGVASKPDSVSVRKLLDTVSRRRDSTGDEVGKVIDQAATDGKIAEENVPRLKAMLSASSNPGAVVFYRATVPSLENWAVEMRALAFLISLYPGEHLRIVFPAGTQSLAPYEKVVKAALDKQGVASANQRHLQLIVPRAGSESDILQHLFRDMGPGEGSRIRQSDFVQKFVVQFFENPKLTQEFADPRNPAMVENTINPDEPGLAAVELKNPYAQFMSILSSASARLSQALSTASEIDPIVLEILNGSHGHYTVNREVAMGLLADFQKVMSILTSA